MNVGSAYRTLNSRMFVTLCRYPVLTTDDLGMTSVSRKHLIVSIGTEVYVTLPKGQLPPTDPSTNSPTSVPGGGHVLIIPVSHYPTFGAIPPAISPSVLSEVDSYKKSLTQLYAQNGSVPVFFEVSRNTGRGAGGHAHVQVVPVPDSKKDEVESAFKAYGGMQMVWEKDPESALNEAVASNENHFKVDLPNGKQMVHLLKQGRPFNLQFGRYVISFCPSTICDDITYAKLYIGRP